MHEFTLLDAEGRPHTYTVTPHRHAEGRRIVNLIGATLATPLGALLSFDATVGGFQLTDLGSVMSKAVASATGAAPDVTVEALLGDKLDLSALGPAVSEALLGLPESFSADVLRHTLRDDRPLSDPSERDRAYARNYREEERALFEVIRYNRFFPSLDTLRGRSRPPATSASR